SHMKPAPDLHQPDANLTPINIVEEIRSLDEYLTSRWDGLQGALTPAIGRIAQAAQRAAAGWWDRYAFWAGVMRLETTRREQLSSALEGRAKEIGETYDSICRQIS